MVTRTSTLGRGWWAQKERKSAIWAVCSGIRPDQAKNSVGLAAADERFSVPRLGGWLQIRGYRGDECMSAAGRAGWSGGPVGWTLTSLMHAGRNFSGWNFEAVSRRWRRARLVGRQERGPRGQRWKSWKRLAVSLSSNLWRDDEKRAILTGPIINLKHTRSQSS
jgi:hypothetical protein